MLYISLINAWGRHRELNSYGIHLKKEMNPGNPHYTTIDLDCILTNNSRYKAIMHLLTGSGSCHYKLTRIIVNMQQYVFLI